MKNLPNILVIILLAMPLFYGCHILGPQPENYTQPESAVESNDRDKSLAEEAGPGSLAAASGNPYDLSSADCFDFTDIVHNNLYELIITENGFIFFA